mmetsp:Transcript_6627/g.12784  ORF Transcript_6627/g.12784 Transcript_6627/m.12784 type:complete len:469 (+) Transcript_6627:65-1471(+)
MTKLDNLILLAKVLLLSLALGGLGSDLLVILLEGGKILTGLGELSLLHTLTDVPMDEGTLGVHEIELVVNARKSLGDGSGVGHHAHSALHTSQVTAGDDSGGLVVDSALEASGAPVDELHGSLGLDGGDGRVDILGDNISSVHQAASHVLSVAGVALGHHVGGLEHRVGDLGHRQLLVVRLLGRDDGGVRGKHEMDSGVGHQVGLELRDIHVQGTIEAKRSGQGRHDLGNESVQVGIGRSLDVQVSAAHVVQGLVIKAESTVGMLEQRMGRQDVVVGLHNSGGHLGGRGHGEGKLGLAAVVDRKSLQKKRTKTRSGTTTSGVEDHESLKTGAVVSQLSHAVKHEVNNLLSDGVVTTGVVVGGILLAGDQLLRVVELSVGAGANLVHHTRLEVDHDGTGNVLASASLGEKGVEGVIATADGLVGGHLAIRLDSVLKAVQLPAGISGLDTSLTNVDRKTFTHFEEVKRES